MNHKIPIVFSILLMQNFNQVSAEPDKKFTVYCTGNHDTTGSCIKASDSTDSNELNCIMVPGNIIDCKSGPNASIECILINATSAQAEFFCNENKEGLIRPGETSSTGNTIEKYKNEDVENDSDSPQLNVFNDPF